MLSILKMLSIFSSRRGPDGPDLPSPSGRKFQLSLHHCHICCHGTMHYQSTAPDWLNPVISLTISFLLNFLTNERSKLNNTLRRLLRYSTFWSGPYSREAPNQTFMVLGLHFQGMILILITSVPRKKTC